METEDYAHITFLIDISASMRQGLTEARENSFVMLKDQREIGENLSYSLYTFNDRVNCLKHFESVSDIESQESVFSSLHARGNTALFSAIDRALNDTINQLATLPEDRRPKTISFVIASDGQENASRGVTKDSLKERIEYYQNECGWNFYYLGADFNAFSYGSSIGINAGTTSNYRKGDNGTGQAFTSTSELIRRNRLGERNASYSEEDRTRMMQS